MFQLTDTLIAELQTMDTPTVCNALELLVPQRRGYGYTSQPLVGGRGGADTLNAIRIAIEDAGSSFEGAKLEVSD